MRFLFLLGIIFYSTVLYGQRSDSASAEHFPHHNISINPLKFGLFQQAGISYEYRFGRLGLGISTGYIYPSRLNPGRLFIARTTNFGAFEFYKGFFLDPQFKLYLNKPQNTQRKTHCYLALRGVYKYMYVDSTHYYIWNRSSGGDYYWYYRKQIDKVNILGAFFTFGVMHVKNHFLVDFNIGPGLLAIKHDLIVAGEGHFMNDNISNVNPPRKEKFTHYILTFTMNINFGGAL